MFPAGLISTNTSVSIEFWASYSPTNVVWTRTFAFGDQTGAGGENTGFDYTHYAGGNIMFLDGHVDWRNFREMTNVSLPSGGHPGFMF
ncbi:MAG TPA: hypothetical protein VGY56_13225 [Verrucomicrobiae bacterium]|nr:hypothetical protein [Verrucomicrobiae bacterium]